MRISAGVTPYRYATGAWTYKATAWSNDYGNAANFVWCGSKCTKVRERVQNWDSRYHEYDLRLYTTSRSWCGK